MGAGFGGGINKSRSNTVTNEYSRPVMPGWGKKPIMTYLANLAALQNPGAYADPALGYDRATLSMMPGQANDAAYGAKKAAAESITANYARPGAPGTGSYAEGAALSALDNEYAARGGEAMRSTLLADQNVRREDAARRLNFGLSAGNLARNWAATRSRQRRQFSTVGGQVSYGGDGGTPQTPGNTTAIGQNQAPASSDPNAYDPNAYNPNARKNSPSP